MMNICARSIVIAAAGAGALAGGCGPPNQANILLRKQNQQLQNKIESLQQQSQADEQVMRGLRAHIPTVPVLPPDRLARLFTTHGLKFGRLTGGYTGSSKSSGDQGIKVYVVPADASGQPLKAAGSFTIDVFDLAQPKSPLIGHWTFDVAQARQNWFGRLFDYTYVFTLPWQQVPRHSDLTIRVTFLDELTQIPFTAETVVHVNPPSASQAPPETVPTTQSAHSRQAPSSEK